MPAYILSIPEVGTEDPWGLLDREPIQTRKLQVYWETLTQETGPGEMTDEGT